MRAAMPLHSSIAIDSFSSTASTASTDSSRSPSTDSSGQRVDDREPRTLVRRLVSDSSVHPGKQRGVRDVSSSSPRHFRPCGPKSISVSICVSDQSIVSLLQDLRHVNNIISVIVSAFRRFRSLLRGYLSSRWRWLCTLRRRRAQAASSAHTHRKFCRSRRLI